MLRAPLTVLLIAAALPAAAQDRGGVPMRNTATELGLIEANQGCPLSATSVTIGVNNATGTGSSAQQHQATQTAGSPSACRPLVSTQVVTGVNLALGRGSSAGQTIGATGPAGLLATDTFTRGFNTSFGAGSTANQRIFNQTSR